MNSIGDMTMWVVPLRYAPIYIDPGRTAMPAHDTLTAAAHRTRLTGFHDLQGRESLPVVLQGYWCYVGRLPGYLPNPFTGKSEHSGTSILDVADPAKPTLIAHIPSAPEANCRAVQGVNNPHDGKRYLARNHETAAACSFQIFEDHRDDHSTAEDGDTNERRRSRLPRPRVHQRPRGHRITCG